MKFLHSMIRVSDPEATVAFFQLLGLEERRRMKNEAGRYTLIFLGVPGDDAEVELTHNWGETGYSGGRNFGHLAYAVDDIYAAPAGCITMIDMAARSIALRRYYQLAAVAGTAPNPAATTPAASSKSPNTSARRSPRHQTSEIRQLPFQPREPSLEPEDIWTCMSASG